MQNHEGSIHCYCRCFWDYLTPFTKIWGVFTSVVLYGVGVDILVHHHITGLYIILGSVALFFLEIAWAIALFFKVCIRDEESRIFACWEGVLWMKEWKKTIVYVAFGIGLMCKQRYLWLSSVAAIMLIILGFLHFFLQCEDKIRGYNKEALLNKQDSYFDRLQDISDTDNVTSKDETTENILNGDFDKA